MIVRVDPQEEIDVYYRDFSQMIYLIYLGERPPELRFCLVEILLERYARKIGIWSKQIP